MKLLGLALLAAGVLPGAGQPVDGWNRFAIESYRELTTPGRNLIFSPFSISTALSMTLAGARGQTAVEMARVLGRIQPGPDYHQALAAVVEQLRKAGNQGRNELHTANGLWVQAGFPVLPEFTATLRSAYDAPPCSVDFQRALEAARGEINDWTLEQTKGKIGELFPPGSLDASSRLVLTSAIYFNGKWESPFRRQETKRGPFRLPWGGPVETDFMNRTASFGYAETPVLQVLEMKYEGTSLAFDVLLPKAVGGLQDLERTLTLEQLAGWLGGLQSRQVAVSVPKFRSEAAISLKDTLSAMGMPSAFRAGADFSGVDGRHDLVLSDVKHKAYIEVSEEGTVAAAATGVGVSLVSMPAQPAIFRADHPFLFLVRDTASGLILFAGRLAAPAR